jgi:DNA-directed RNA polymerase specialized sigma24 family protein
MGKRLSPPDGTVTDGFGTTSWSLVLSAGRNEDGGAALDRLCRRYRKVIVVYSQRLGLSPHDAEDATQDFFAFLLDRKWLSEAGPAKGSFRGFIYTLLRHFLSNRRRTEESQKRGGRPHLGAAPVIEVDGLASAEPDPAASYDRMWAICVVESAASRLAEEQSGAGQAVRFQALRGFLTRSPTTADYDGLVQVLGEPRNRIAVYLHRLVRRYGELIRAEVADTLANLDDVDIELRRLMEVLSV